jgi:hypothetical protein
MSEQQVPIEQEARSMGWVPLEEFRGDPERFVSAEDFVDKGRHVMPILKANNKRLEGEVERLRAEQASLQELVRSSQQAIEDLKEASTEATRAAVKRAREELIAGIKTAREEGDVDGELRLNEELADLRKQEAEVKKAPAQAKAPETPQADPDLVAWVNENKWYGSDLRKTMRANGIAQQLRADPANDGLTQRAFYDKVLEVMEEQTRGTPVSKVSGGRSSQASAGSGSKTYASLPADAKEACDRQGKRLVGQGKAFKDVAAWQSHYAKLYYAGDAQ